MADSVLGNLLNLGGSAYGYNETQDMLKNTQKDVNNTVANASNLINEGVQFQPWGVTSQTGTSTAGPDGMNYELGAGGQYLTAGLQGMGVQQLQNGMMSPLDRQNQLYGAMNAAQAPEQQRQQQMLQEQLARSGRSGMFSSLHGGTPEQLAMQKAIQEQQSSNWLGAGGQANQELMNQYTQGMGMLGASYDPMKMLMAQGEQTLAGAGQANTMMQQKAGMLTDLQLGKMNANTNLSGQQSALTADALASMTGNDGLFGNIGDMITGGVSDWWTNRNVNSGIDDIFNGKFGNLF